MPLTNLVFRLVKGSPLSDVEGDGNLSDIQDFVNGLEAIQSVSLNPDGTLKNGTLNSPAQLANIPALADTFSSNETAPAGVLGTNIYAVNNANITAYQKGMQLRFVANAANTGLCSVQVNPGATLPIVALTVVPIVKSVNVQLAANDILAGQMVELRYDGTNFQLVFMAPTVASSADIIAGTNNQKIVTALALAGTEFKSGVFLLGSPGIVLDLPHGLGVTPKVKGVLVCQTNEAGYIVGEEVNSEAFMSEDSTASVEKWMPFVTCGAGSFNGTYNTNAFMTEIAVGNQGVFVTHKTTGLQTNINQAHWKGKVYANP